MKEVFLVKYEERDNFPPHLGGGGTHLRYKVIEELHEAPFPNLGVCRIELKENISEHSVKLAKAHHKRALRKIDIEEQILRKKQEISDMEGELASMWRAPTLD
jgi:hypothetical protein